MISNSWEAFPNRQVTSTLGVIPLGDAARLVSSMSRLNDAGPEVGKGKERKERLLTGSIKES